jgi:hypothetical protein
MPRHAFDQNGLAPPEVDVGGQVGDALVISIVIGDDGLDLGFKIARQRVVFDQDAASA